MRQVNYKGFILYITLAANQAQLPCAAISIITDECDPDNLKRVNIAEIIEVAGKVDAKLAMLFAAAI
ncbi:MAG: hypothetical protein ACKVOM_04265 [Ferruginibacter sp.]